MRQELIEQELVEQITLKLIEQIAQTLKMAYLKHVAGDDSVGWDELECAISDTLSNLMGIEAFCIWQEERLTEHDST